MNAVELRSIDFLKKKLGSDRRWAVRALERIYNNQCPEEIQAQRTLEKNGVGFSSVDADILTQMHEFYQKHGYLSDKQLDKVVFKRMPRYASQLYRMISEKIEDKNKLDKMAENFLGPIELEESK